MNQDLLTPENYNIEPDVKFSGSFCAISINENITPQIYLEFAIEDFESGRGNRSKINAFANAKRALHFQTDLISQAFGIEHLPKKFRDNFPKKISFCEKCGIVGSRVLNKLNEIRNKIEHEYYLPKNDDVENIIDVVELFLAATARFISLFPTDIEVDLVPKNNIIVPAISGIEFPVGKGTIYLFPDIKEIDKSQIDFANLVEWQRKKSICFNVYRDEQYYKWVKYLISSTL